ncbi:ABC transporter ATP-binding protein [Gluconacetobacter tumulicola]|uniref:ABC transporter ATP-binding protein n=1 Tax=Gluconacetobacter tumulicola TaxID=1017177 RepID=A0A7W4JG44_9PROT|nr:ABC transporter ATP-binding protein [Gluconacetobacter tumulicola]MBB2180608.1 ABC transporter ATP-binding protein [Gluconacetobacter tumulicola]
MSRPILSVRKLAVTFAQGSGPDIPAVEGASFDVGAGETVAIVGESSSGKSVTAMALLGLLPAGAGTIVSGQALFRRDEAHEVDLLALPEREMRALRGRDISMVFQDPMTSLNPVLTIGEQIAEVLTTHDGLTRRQARATAVDLLARVGLRDPGQIVSHYPGQLSGGMRQRVMIAMALACRPRLLIADEPTTALDVTVQAQILALLRQLQAEMGMAIIFITHNIGVVAQISDRVVVMYSGQVVENAPVRDALDGPLMPYSSVLFRTVPTYDAVLARRRRLPTIPGHVPDPRHRPQGCTFHPRCAHFRPGVCDMFRPSLEAAREGHEVRCVRWQEIARG